MRTLALLATTLALAACSEWDAPRANVADSANRSEYRDTTAVRSNSYDTRSSTNTDGLNPNLTRRN
jgi:hypothetical protein